MRKRDSTVVFAQKMTTMKDELRMAVEWREDDSRTSPGRLVGTLLKYGERAKDRAEVFEAGSLRWPERGVILNRQHLRSSPILRFQPVVVEDEIRIEVELPDSTAGRDAASEVRSGLFQGLSIEFQSVKENFVGGIRRIQEAMLTGAALVDSPSYATSVEVRRGQAKRRVRRWL